jgi:hypothetical protein
MLPQTGSLLQAAKSSKSSRMHYKRKSNSIKRCFPSFWTNRFSFSISPETIHRRAHVVVSASSPTAARPRPLPLDDGVPPLLPLAGGAAPFPRPGGAAASPPSSSRWRCGPTPILSDAWHRGPVPFLPAAAQPHSSVPVALGPRPLPPPSGGVAPPPSSSRQRRGPTPFLLSLRRRDPTPPSW